MNKNSLIVAQNIGYKINENKLFHNISFDIKHGEALHIKGRNGSGKSTLIRIILGITEPVKGTIENKSTKEICYLGHKNALKTYLTLDDNINLMQLTNCDMLKSYLDKLEQGIFFNKRLYFSVGGIGNFGSDPFNEISKRFYTRIDPQNPLPALIIRTTNLEIF